MQPRLIPFLRYSAPLLSPGVWLVTAGVSCSVASAQVAGDWAKHFRLGTQVALNIKADFSMGGQFGISGNNPGATGVPQTDHVYDDGYVKVDQTGNAQGYTSYWGYSNASQYDGASTLTMHSSRSFSAAENSTRASGDPNVGLDMAYGAELAVWKRTLIGWDFGFSYLPIKIQDRRSMSTTTLRTTHTFQTGGIQLPGEDYAGGNSGIGPGISDEATPAADGPPLASTLTGPRSVDVTLYNFRLGPTAYWDLGSRLALQASAGFAMGLIDGAYKYNEQIVNSDGTGSPNSGSINMRDTVYGGYVNTTLMWRTHERADIYVGAQFMTLGNSRVSGPGRSAELQLGRGIYFSAGINWPF